ncbi:MAG: DUF3320 domain-containing protein [Planctomycetota bacterium]
MSETERPENEAAEDLQAEPRSDDPIADAVAPDSAGACDVDEAPNNAARGDPSDTESDGDVDVETTPVESPLSIDVTYREVVGFATHQHGVPVIDRLEISNNGDEALGELDVSVRITNGAAAPWAAKVDSISPGRTVHLDAAELSLASEPLARQTERERTELVVDVRAEGVTPAVWAGPLDVLAADEWGGARVLPELLASFSLPNHPAIEPLLLRANQLLKDAGVPAGLDGYQSRDSRRARQLAESGYGALLERGLEYVTASASFEAEGQRVRLADRVLETRLGNCLDLSLLLAGVWEKSGLHPIIVLFESHAIAGVWTRPEHFADAVLDSDLSVIKRAELDEIVLVESTLLTKGDSGGFNAASMTGFDRLAEDKGSVQIIDIRAARKLGVRPLPIRVDRDAALGDGEANEDSSAATYTLSPDAPTPSRPEFEPLLVEEPVSHAAADGDRLSRWKRRLLDLSLRNRLINFRETRRTIPLVSGDVASLEDRLASGGSLELRARPLKVPEGPRDEDGVSPRTAFVRAELAAGRALVDLTEAETQRRSIELFRDARSSIEETGANLLHVALGTLVWSESQSGEAREAPLVLVPVKLERPGGGRPLRMSISDEPARANAALLEKLRVEFNIDDPSLGELPEDERGIDIPLIFRRYREVVKRVSGWEVLETARLGLFSFSRFLMWRDLEARADDLRKSALVRRLVEDRDEEGDDADPIVAERLEDPDAILKPGALLLTREADASQLEAVHAAGQGETFVLQGPPGTGKSQTIANLIADALGRGERVLFVAEKRAALSVVRRRLEQDGLGPFCLELHSNRASKREVLAQLGETLELVSTGEPEGWDSTCEKLAEARDRLNDLVHELNDPQPSGESVRGVIERLAELGDGPTPRLAVGEPADLGAEQLEAVRARVDGLAQAARVAQADRDDLGSHPLRGIGVREFSFRLPDNAATELGVLAKQADALREAANAWVEAIGLLGDGDEVSAREVEWRAEAVQLLANCPGTTKALLEEPEWPEVRADLERWISRGRERNRRRKSLLQRYDRAILTLDLPTLTTQAKRATAKSGLGKWWGTRPVRSALKAVALDKAPDADQAAWDVEEARAVVEETEALSGAAEPARLLGRRWAEGEADWDLLVDVVAWTDAARALLAEAGAGPESLGLPAIVRDLATGDGDPLAEAGPGLTKALAQFIAARDRVSELLSVDWRAAWNDRTERRYLIRVAELAERWRASLPELSDWCAWQTERELARSAGLVGLVDGLEEGSLAPDEVVQAFERSFGRRWLSTTADRLERIRTFSGRAHNQAIRRFAELDAKLLDLTRQLVRARLAAAVPPPSSNPSPHSEIGVLKRQLELKRRHLPIRQLMERIPGTLARLKPCFLMSPLSIAQYLDPALPPFDLVVFDEASQIPPWEAIGAIARGSRVVVVGDSKQLPPTSFFEKSEPEDDETATEAEELESILQECVASGVPARRLLWHYRSRHDSLIAFSNEHYYDNTLRTFPAPVEPGDELGVSFRRVEGAYDRGSSRTNRAEAEAIVDEVVKLLREGGQTIGVVSFNLAQQVLIEDFLDERCRKDSALEEAREAGDEPLFIKNLESVQGDERDVILFSVTYGPGESSKMSMNFGPLNRDGGERRLNVAVTRARRRVVAFASFDPEAIDPARTGAVGVKHLRRFLEFARSGRVASAAHDAVELGAIGRAVADELCGNGHDVAEHVGSGGSRVELAVRDPGDPTRFILGIEFDGASYADARTARDRDRLRPSVMAGLGWRLHKVWSVEWHLNREGVMRSLERAITEARRAAKREPAAEELIAEAESVEDAGSGLASAPPAVAREPEAVMMPDYAAWFPQTLIGDRDALLDEANSGRAREVLVEIVEVEAPVTRTVVIRRLSEAFGVDRLTKAVRDHCASLLNAAVAKRLVREVGDAIWAKSGDTTLDAPRRPGTSEHSKRSLDEIPLVERIAAVKWVLDEQVALPDEELAKHAARVLGTHRLTEKVAGLMNEAIEAYRADQDT